VLVSCLVEPHWHCQVTPVDGRVGLRGLCLGGQHWHCQVNLLPVQDESVFLGERRSDYQVNLAREQDE
jgi:hypothetical protein